MTTNEDSKSLSQQRFGKFARGYVTSETHAKGVELDRLVEIAQPQPDWFMLDIATGGGHTALKFSPLVAQVVATDITPKMLDTAAAFLTSQGAENVKFEPADAENLPFQAEIFDLVTCRIAPHHFPDCPRFVQEATRVLKPDGLLLVQDHLMPEDEESARYVNEFQKLRDPSHNQAYTESEWVGMFQEAGLQVEHTEQIIKHHEFYPWVERQDCAQEVVQRLISMIAEAPPPVIEWMQPRDFGSPEAIYADYHIIIAGRKV
ncbi:class I SAM-dependent methyltransferase [Candidatus Poribacteria bacterium]